MVLNSFGVFLLYHYFKRVQYIGLLCLRPFDAGTSLFRFFAQVPLLIMHLAIAFHMQFLNGLISTKSFLLLFFGCHVADRFIEIRGLESFFGDDFLLNTFIQLVYLLYVLLNFLLFCFYDA